MTYAKLWEVVQCAFQAIEIMPKKRSTTKAVKPLPCPVCGRIPEVETDRLHAEIRYYLICKDSSLLGWHEIYIPSWETIELAINRWNHAVKSWEKKRAKNIKDRETWG
jgi:hypothetical protein